MTKMLIYFSGRNSLWGRETLGLRLAKLLAKRYDEVWIFLGNNAVYLGKKGLTKPEAVALDEAVQAGCKVSMWEEDMGFRGVTKDMVKDYVQILDTDAYMDTLVLCDKTIAF